jgi:hypothetical protein
MVPSAENSQQRSIMPPPIGVPPTDVYVRSESNNQAVISRVAAGSGTVTQLAQDISFSDMAVDGAGNLIVATATGVLKIPAGGGAATTINAMSAQGVAVDWAGNIYMTDWSFNPGQVWRIPADGTPPRVIWSGAGSAWAVAADGLQNAYLFFSPPINVIKVPPGGGPPTVIDLSGDFGAFGGTAALAVDPQGQNLFLGRTDLNADQTITCRLIRVPLNGDPHSSFPIDPIAAAGFAADEYGNVYIADHPNDRVVMVTDSGSGSQATIGQIAKPLGVAVRPTRAHRWTVPALIGKLFGSAAVDGGGWIVIGDHFIPIPPRSPELAILVQSAMRYSGRAIRSPELGDQLRNLR